MPSIVCTNTVQRLPNGRSGTLIKPESTMKELCIRNEFYLNLLLFSFLFKFFSYFFQKLSFCLLFYKCLTPKIYGFLLQSSFFTPICSNGYLAGGPVLDIFSIGRRVKKLFSRRSSTRYIQKAVWYKIYLIGGLVQDILNRRSCT